MRIVGEDDPDSGWKVEHSLSYKEHVKEMFKSSKEHVSSPYMFIMLSVTGFFQSFEKFKVINM
jgi:hypothetical protein